MNYLHKICFVLIKNTVQNPVSCSHTTCNLF